MAVIGINGSPRKDGSTARILRQILSGAADAGASTTQFDTGAMEISPCTACMGCRSTAQCTVADDMQAIYQALNANQAPRCLVIATPIYFDHVTAQLKAWIDRLYCYTYTRKGQITFPKGYKAVLAITYDWDLPGAYDGVFDWLQQRMEDYHGIHVIDRLAVHNANNWHLEDRPELLVRAHEIGGRLASA